MAGDWVSTKRTLTTSCVRIPARIREGSREHAATVARFARENLSVDFLSLRMLDFREMDLSGARFYECSFVCSRLTDANLKETDFINCNFSASDLIEGGKRADGYEFFGQMRHGRLWIKAGCQYFPIDKARKHWMHRRGTQLGAETTAILNRIEATAIARGYLKPKSKTKTKKPATKRKGSK